MVVLSMKKRSPEYKAAARLRARERDKILDCPDCGKKIWLGSSKCKSCAQKNPPRFCGDCGIRVGKKAFKCLPCHNKSQDKGLSKERVKFNNSDAWKAVRKSCFERDNHTCQICRERGGYLNAHHIFFYAEYPQHRLNIHNLITLCHGCHWLVHRCYRKPNEKKIKNGIHSDSLQRDLRPYGHRIARDKEMAHLSRP
jgi:predicted RNA-binding Zn-ribbon protein involved in translation (DUF1610 family)